jgi:uncharacterized protein (TIGR03437 family)
MHRALLFCFSLLPLSAQILVNTYAGGAIPSGVPAQSAYLASVAGIAWDSAGNLVFCDSVNNLIRRVNASGTVETIAGTGVAAFSGDGGPALTAELFSPRSPRFDASGNLYFVDEMNYRIRRIDTNGVISTVGGDGISFVAGMDTSGPATAVSLDYVSDLAAASGDLYFVESSRNRIRRITAAGKVELYAGTGATACPNCSNGDGGPAIAASLNQPTSIAADPNGNVFFVDAFYTVIRKISADGIITTFVPPIYNLGPYQLPATISGLASDPAGDIYAVVGGIVRYNPSGTPTTITTSIVPQSFTVDAEGDIGFSENGTIPYSSILEIGELTTSSTVKMLAGESPQPAPDGTPLTKAWFFSPSSIAFDQSGNLYIADESACQIREISPAGVLSTFAGTGICGFATPSGNAKTADLIYPISIAIDSHNNVWVADDFLNLYSIAQDGTISVLPSRTPVSGGRGWLAFDSKDRLYVGALNSLVRILPDQSVQTIVAPFGVNVDGLGTDPSGNVYFGSTFDVYRVNDDGSYTQVAQSPYGFGPYGGNPAFAVDAAGNIWQASVVTSSSGTALFGTFQSGISGDGGLAVSAGFNASAAAFSPTGTLYFIDTNRIRVLTGSGPLQAPLIAQGGIVNAASYTGGPIAPGELLSIFGSNFGATQLLTNAAVNNSIPTALGRTRVLFNGQPGAVTAVTPNQINVFVPSTYQITPGSPANVQVQVDAALSAMASTPVADSAPGIFTASASGSGQGSILNQDGSVNSSANPAAPGSTISIFGTGEGAITPQLGAGNLVLSTPYPAPVDPVSVTIGDNPAQVIYAGEAPTLPAGVFQINAQIPMGTTGNSVPVSVSIGTRGTGAQVTVAVR